MEVKLFTKYICVRVWARTCVCVCLCVYSVNGTSVCYIFTSMVMSRLHNVKLVNDELSIGKNSEGSSYGTLSQHFDGGLKITQISQSDNSRTFHHLLMIP
jgi:hypothetical protein